MNFVSLVVILSAICGGFATENDIPYNFFETLSDSANKFSYDLFEKIISKYESDGSDVIFSPLSIYSLLSLTALGAGGENYYQMKKALYLPEDDMAIKGAYEYLFNYFKNLQNVSMNMANNVYIESKFDLKPAFVDVAKNYFKASVDRFDRNKPMDAAMYANKWVDQSTNHLVPDMMASYFMDGFKGMTLLSSGFFQGDWKYPFNKEFTKERDFYLGEKESKKVPTMFMEKTFAYGEFPEFKAKFVKLPYQNKDVEMLIILPDEVTGLDYILSNIRQFDEAKIKEASKEAYVKLYLPKFKVASDTFILNGYLRQLGFEDMFRKKYANFTEMSTKDAYLRVDSVLQKPYIEFNEAGTTTKTDPANFFESPSNEVMGAPEIVFDVNRPFYYQISDNGVILFQGATFFGARQGYRPTNMFDYDPLLR